MWSLKINLDSKRCICEHRSSYHREIFCCCWFGEVLRDATLVYRYERRKRKSLRVFLPILRKFGVYCRRLLTFYIGYSPLRSCPYFALVRFIMRQLEWLWTHADTANYRSSVGVVGFDRLRIQTNKTIVTGQCNGRSRKLGRLCM